MAPARDELRRRLRASCRWYAADFDVDAHVERIALELERVRLAADAAGNARNLRAAAAAIGGRAARARRRAPAPRGVVLRAGVVVELTELELRGDEELRHAPAEIAGAEAELAREAPLGPLEAAAWPISQTCSRRYTAVRTSGRRKLSAIRLLVVHCTQGSTARGAAAWFANPRSRGSAHLCVDGVECYRTLSPSWICWGAPGVNGSGWHMELAGFAEWSRAEWLRHRGTLDRGAFKLAWHADAFGLPLRLLTPAAAKGGAKGVITHKIASAAYGGSHWDPGPNFPMDVFLKSARHYREAM